MMKNVGIKFNMARFLEVLAMAFTGTVIVVLGTWVYTQLFQEAYTPASELTPSRHLKEAS